MQKQAPTFGRLMTMVLFALSCFGLLLFLWLSFGGPIPLKPEGYRFQVAFPEATQLGLEADVRVSGVSVGRVRAKELDPRGNRTLATIEVDDRFAPIRRDARAMLRQKTLLGETYVELRPGTPGAPPLPEDGRLPDGRVNPSVELDEVLEALDPRTRQAFRTWQRSQGAAIEGRGRDLNDALGNLPGFVADADDLLTVLDAQDEAVRRLVRNTGTVFGALTEREDQLRNLITGADQTFEATAREQDALAETFRVFPTFLDESKATLARTERFADATRPLLRDLRPAVRDLRPTLRDLRALAPDLQRFYTRLDPLIDVSREGLPALSETLRGASPLLDRLAPFLGQLNPILEWLEYHQRTTADFIMNGAGALVDTVPTPTDDEMGHYLRQFGPSGAESVAMYQERLPTNRGNAYLDPVALQGPERGRRMIFPNWDCRNTGEPGDGSYMTEIKGTSDMPSCFVKPYPPPFGGAASELPRIDAADYRKDR